MLSIIDVHAVSGCDGTIFVDNSGGASVDIGTITQGRHPGPVPEVRWSSADDEGMER